MERLRCVVERITFHSEETGFSILKVRVKGYSELVTAVCTIAETHVGSVLSLEGSWRLNPRYGRQFVAEKYEEVLPATALGIERYLGSGLIRGIGPKFARRIVNAFGKDALEIIENDPDRLSEIPGIGSRRIEMIRTSWEAQREIRNIMLFLQEHEVSATHAAKIYNAYGNESIGIVTENPYRLADDIRGIGFITADTIASKLGFDKECYPRMRAGLAYTLGKLSNDGHCYSTREQLLRTGEELLGIDLNTLEPALDRMLAERNLICDNGAIYLPPIFFCECGCAGKIKALLAEPVLRQIPIDDGPVPAGIEYNEAQLEAIKTAVESKIMVLTGGPGTGKTTATIGIISALERCGCRILLAAPTGRAAKRLAETTGREAKTIHRLLESKPPNSYMRNAEYPLEGDVLIVDECSMIDIVLMNSLLAAVPKTMSLILIGDVDQLPSVGAGNVLNDIISSGIVPVVRLEHVFRQARNSRIITNAHRINRGKFIEIDNSKQSDFFFAAADSPESALALIVDFCSKRLPRYYGADPMTDIQVLTPMQKGTIGAANINQVLQQTLNPGGPYLKRAGVEFRLRDKVMQIKNDYEKEVFNGDIGTITRVSIEDGELGVNFDGRVVVYAGGELDELSLAYATTIHKSQGSEYPIVVMPFMMTHYVMLQRNLLYTGVTRAKKALVLVGEKRALAFAVNNRETGLRNTKLSERLSGKTVERGGSGKDNPQSAPPAD